MKCLSEARPLAKPFKRSARTAHADQSRLVAGDAQNRFHEDRVVRCRSRLRGEEVGEQRPPRRFAQVAGVRLECQSRDGNMAPEEVAEAYLPGKKCIPSPFLGCHRFWAQ